LPKGSLQQATINLLESAGYEVRLPDRSYYPSLDDPELEATLIRAQEIPHFVEQGVFDVGITGWDWVVETGAKVKEICELVYSKQGFSEARWVLAVPEDSKVRRVSDLRGKRITTELVNVTRKFLAARKVRAEVEFSWGATEAKVPLLFDAMVELTETGASLRAHRLRIVEEVLRTSTRLIGNRDSIKQAWKRKKAENLATLLDGALRAQGMVGVKMNVARADLKKVLAALPALKQPTISDLADANYVAVEVVAETKLMRDLIPELRRAGASGIIEYPLRKVIP
jgi:ATP phosphoribosyltransferase